jgi:flagellar biosynthesis protein FlhF
MEKLALTLARSGPGVAGSGFTPDLAKAFTRLTDAELDTDLAYDVLAKLTSPISELGLRAAVAKLVHTDAHLGINPGTARVVVLVGPPGAGKTSTLAKLAVQFGLAVGKSVQLLTTDTFRIAAATELRSYAAILGIGCQVLESPGELLQAIEGHRQKDLILVDTPGLCRLELDAGEELAEVLAQQTVFDTHLVLPASMRTADLRRISEQYRIFTPRKLLFTRMDETEIVGPILSLSVRMGLPVSFFSHGQRIPEDLEPATPDLLLNQLLGTLSDGTPKFDVVAA